MKISIEVDCTPDEARKFLGLPDLSAANDAFADALTQKMAAALDGLDAEALLKTWLPAAMPAMEQVQKAFWEQFAAMGGAAKPKE